MVSKASSEQWKDIPGYEGIYQVSSKGRIKSLGGLRVLFGNGPNSRKAIVKDKILKPAIDSGGYYYVNLAKNGIQRTKNIHRLVAETFIPNPKNLRDVNHKNGDKLDNNVENLEWLSHSDNIKHSFMVLKRKNDSTKKRVKNTLTKKIYPSITIAAKQCNISTTVISHCINRKNNSSEKEWIIV